MFRSNQFPLRKMPFTLKKSFKSNERRDNTNKNNNENNNKDSRQKKMTRGRAGNKMRGTKKQ